MLGKARFVGRPTVLAGRELSRWLLGDQRQNSTSRRGFGSVERGCRGSGIRPPCTFGLAETAGYPAVFRGCSSSLASWVRGAAGLGGVGGATPWGWHSVRHIETKVVR